MTILDKIIESTKLRVERERLITPIEALIAECEGVPRLDFEFETALKADGVSFICEVKKASPSKGVIAPDFPYLDIARDYEMGGAACVSVLTEPDYFLGSDAYLQEIALAIHLPTLRKDFIIDPMQIYQARLLGARAVLLICSALGSNELYSYLTIANDLGLSALVEVHDKEELTLAAAAGARLIGVNNRNLKTFDVDISNSIRLREFAPPGIIFTAESGIKTRGDVELLEAHGIDAVLVGETLMRSGDRQAALRALSGAADTNM
ncbi:MAG: indole-3-glycerol phosphate synthase TrpC [Clostridiales Family XIII bacterium]|jgi:indole-3-glycerol phosphate synthase|nr:indole-3-glycerol phosphate synthase TrpC [Clostridiales Family XIII bacterium]